MAQPRVANLDWRGDVSSRHTTPGSTGAFCAPVASTADLGAAETRWVRCFRRVRRGTVSLIPRRRLCRITDGAGFCPSAAEFVTYCLRPAGGSCEPWHPAHTLALAGRCVVRPVDALTTATARVVPFACACDDVWHSCSSVGVIGRSATPGACSRSPSLPPEAPSLGRHCPASTVIRASPPPWPARPCPHGSSVGACYATGRASRVASIPLFHTCRRHYPGGTGRCSRRSLPDRWQPSPIFGRVGFRVARFEACSAFTRVAARVLAEPPKAALCRRSASADVVTSIVRSDCYRLERQLPGGIRTRWGMAPFTAHQIEGLCFSVGVRSGFCVRPARRFNRRLGYRADPCAARSRLRSNRWTWRRAISCDSPCRVMPSSPAARATLACRPSESRTIARSRSSRASASVGRRAVTISRASGGRRAERRPTHGRAAAGP